MCRLGEDEMEVGMGLHGEPGASTQKMQCVNDIVKKVSMFNSLLSFKACLCLSQATCSFAALLQHIGRHHLAFELSLLPTAYTPLSPVLRIWVIYSLACPLLLSSTCSHTIHPHSHCPYRLHCSHLAPTHPQTHVLSSTSTH